MAKKVKPFPTEADLCAAFIDALPPEWTAYAETAGWDILLVRRSDGFQIGIEAKLRLNTDVINQAIEDGCHYSADHAGPDCRAVLVPNDDARGFDKIAAYIGFTIIRMSASNEWNKRDRFRPWLPRGTGNFASFDDDWFELCPGKRHELPEYVPDVAAGASAPLQLTAWKISAIKIAVILETRGWVARSDFKHVGIDYRRWIAAESRWLVKNDGRWIAGEHMPNFKAQHPRVYNEIVADAEKWMPNTIGETATQRALAL